MKLLYPDSLKSQKPNQVFAVSKKYRMKLMSYRLCYYIAAAWNLAASVDTYSIRCFAFYF